MKIDNNDIPLYHRNTMTKLEVERMRLLLSTYCDGSGQQIGKFKWTLPDYLDFERVTAEIVGGHTNESKAVFDVFKEIKGGKHFGISCKMAGPGLVSQKESSFIELTNSAKKLNEAALDAGIVWHKQPKEFGALCVNTVQSWHTAVANEYDLDKSIYLLLTHDRKWDKFMLSSYKLDLNRVDPEKAVTWTTRYQTKKGKKTPTCVYGTHKVDGKNLRLWEIYPESGGQMKYSPLWDWALWKSDSFTLEHPRIAPPSEKAEEYFPELWKKANS